MTSGKHHAVTRIAWVLSLTALLLGCPRPAAGVHGAPRTEVRDDDKADGALQAARAKVPRKKAIEALLVVRQTFPDTTAGQDALYEAGALAFAEGDWVLSRKALGELLFENPLHPKALDARLKSGLAAVELKAYRDAYQTLSTLVERLEGEDRVKALSALEKAQVGAQTQSQALKVAVKAVEDAGGEGREAALAALEVVVESKSTFLTIAEVWNDLPSSHPAWPLLTFKLARIHYHLRDWTNLSDTLKALVDKAPSSPWAEPAKEMLARAARRSDVKPKVVGAVLPLSGKFKALGEAVLRGLQLGLKGSDIELIAKDSQGDVNLAGKMVEELALDESALAIVGPLLGDDSRRAALVAEELQIPIVTMTRAEGITGIGAHVFRNMVTSAQQARALVDYAAGTLGYKSFGVLYPNIPFGVELTNAFWDEVDKHGGTMRAAESYDHDQKTFSTEVKKLVGRYYLEDRSDYLEKVRDIRDGEQDAFRKRKAIEKLKGSLEPVVDFEALLIPDSWQNVGLVAPALAVEDVVSNACDPKDLEKIKKTTGRKDMKTVTLLGPSTWSSPKNANGELELLVRGGKFVQCSVYVDGFFEGSSRKATKAFVAAFKEAHGSAQPSLLDAYGYDTGAMVRSVIATYAPKTRGAFRAGLASLKDFEGATGTTRFDDNREAIKPLFLLTVDPKEGLKEIVSKPKAPGS